MSGVDFEIWLNHFEYHAQHPHCLPPEVPDLLKPAERRLIARSMPTFQLGEQSEGHLLLRVAQRLASEHGTRAVVRIVELFIREKRRHAALLRAFMEEHDIALERSDWTEQVLSLARQFGGLELRLNVLISAELIGIVYYRALEAATDCQRLKLLCRALVSDALAHLGFESHLLLALRAKRAGAGRILMRSAHRASFVVTAGIVWLAHRAVLRGAGYKFRSFLRVCLSQYRFHLGHVRLTLASTPAA
jgi:hypothetical protein